MRIILGPGVTVTREQVETSPVFSDWVARLGPAWQGEVTVTDADFWGGEVHALQVTVAAEGDPWPSKLTLRSETVDVLVVVTDGERNRIIFVEQYRPAAGAQVISNVAGGLGWSESPLEAAGREVAEELGLDSSVQVEYALLAPNPVLATPGLTNERVHMVRAVIRISAVDYESFMSQFRGKRTGVEAEGESIVTHSVPASQARDFILSQSDPDAKTLLSLGLANL